MIAAAQLQSRYADLSMSHSEARASAKAAAQARIDAANAAYATRTITEADWQIQVTDALAAAYLLEDDPRWQSGFDGDAELWRQARSLVLDAVPNAGSFLDVGCATGHLMQSLAQWADERGIELELFGLELNPALAIAARQRLPAWAERIYTGNVMTWQPPRRFTYVRTGLEYVPPDREAALLARLHRDVVETGGRLLVGPVIEGAVPSTVSAFIAAGLPEPSVTSMKDRNGKTRAVVWASHVRDRSSPA